jgi:hypothetical protein
VGTRDYDVQEILLITCWVSSARQNRLLEKHIVILSTRVSHRVEGMSLQAAGWCAALTNGQPSELSEGVQYESKEMNEF